MSFHFKKSQNIKFHPAIILLTSLAISLSLVFFSSAQTYTTPISSTPDIQAIIKQLQDQIKLLNQQIIELQLRVEKTEEEVQVVKAELKLTKTIRKGESSDEVKQLQEFLKQFPDIYPEGLVTGFFGSLTETAVKRFQEKHGIESVGIVGPKTIQKLSEVFTEKVQPAIPAIPALPAIPAIPASPSQPLVSPTTTPKSASSSFSPTPIVQPATPATPAIPAIPAQPVTSSPTPTATASPSFSSTPTPTPTPTPSSTLSGSPPVISNIQLSSTTNSFTVKWTTDKSSDSLVKYYIDLTPYDTKMAIYYEGLYINSEKYDSAMATNHSITIDNLSSGIDFRFQIFSKDNNGNISTDLSYFLGWTLAASPTPTPTPDTTPPSAPTGLSAAATSPSQINLSWNATTDNIGVTGYKIYRNGAIWWSIWDPAIRSFSDTGLSSNTSYSYYVTAFDAAGNNSPASATVSATTQSGTISCSGLNLTFQNNKTSYVKGEWVNYTWVCAPGGTTSYVEIQVVKPDGTATMYNSSGGSTQTFGFNTENLTAGNYILRACFSVGCSSVTASLQFTITDGTSTSIKTTSFFGFILEGFSKIFRR